MLPSSAHDRSHTYPHDNNLVRPPASIPGTNGSSSSSSTSLQGGMSSSSNRGAGSMSLQQQNMVGLHNSNSNEDRDPTGGFEFTRRKKWPQLLLQELVGSAQFCLIPTVLPPQNGSNNNGESSQKKWGWKMLFVSPGSGDLLGRSSSELEGRDFFELVFGADQDQLHTLFNSLIVARPPMPHHSSTTSTNTDTTTTPTSSDSSGPRSDTDLSTTHTIYVRLLQSDIETTSMVGVTGRSGSGPKIWELRVHTTGVGEGGSGVGSGGGGGTDGEVGFGPGGAGTGTVVPTGGRLSGSTEGGEGNGVKGAAIWVMGRKIPEVGGEIEGNSKSLDAFLELKLENERLREELRELQMEGDWEVDPRASYSDPTRYSDHTSTPSSSSTSTSTPSSPSSPTSPPLDPSISTGTTSTHPNRAQPTERRKYKPKKLDKDYILDKKKGTVHGSGGREKKRKTKDEFGDFGVGVGVGGAGGVAGGKPGIGEDGLHVCVTCGRTDSPEWRKGPLGPKTLCNACGLRWAKRNSTQPSRKEKKAAAEKNKG